MGGSGWHLAILAGFCTNISSSPASTDSDSFTPYSANSSDQPFCQSLRSNLQVQFLPASVEPCEADGKRMTKLTFGYFWHFDGIEMPANGGANFHQFYSISHYTQTCDVCVFRTYRLIRDAGSASSQLCQSQSCQVFSKQTVLPCTLVSWESASRLEDIRDATISIYINIYIYMYLYMHIISHCILESHRKQYKQ